MRRCGCGLCGSPRLQRRQRGCLLGGITSIPCELLSPQSNGRPQGRQRHGLQEERRGARSSLTLSSPAEHKRPACTRVSLASGRQEARGQRVYQMSMFHDDGEDVNSGGLGLIGISHSAWSSALRRERDKRNEQTTTPRGSVPEAPVLFNQTCSRVAAPDTHLQSVGRYPQ